MNAVAGVTVAAITWAVAPALSGFFRTPELEAILQVLGICVIFKAMAVVPMNMLARHGRFRAIAIGEISATVVGGATGLAAAYAGLEYWSLVVQTVLLDATLVVLLIIAARADLRVRGSLADLRDLWSYSSRVLASQVMSYGSRNVDNLIIARFLGSLELGFYSIAYRTLMLPLQLLSQSVMRVAFPAMSRLQESPAALTLYFQYMNRLISICAFPAMALIVVGAPTVVPIVLGPDWDPAVLPMQVLAFTALRQSVTQTIGTVLLSIGRSDVQMRYATLSAILLVSSFLVGVRWGITGVAVAYSTVDALLHPFLVRAVSKHAGVSVRGYVTSLLPASVAVVGLVIGYYGVVFLTPSAGLPMFIQGSLVGMAVYMSTMMRLSPQGLADVMGVLTLGRRQRGAPVAGAESVRRSPARIG